MSGEQGMEQRVPLPMLREFLLYGDAPEGACPKCGGAFVGNRTRVRCIGHKKPNGFWTLDCDFESSGTALWDEAMAVIQERERVLVTALKKLAVEKPDHPLEWWAKHIAEEALEQVGALEEVPE